MKLSQLAAASLVSSFPLLYLRGSGKGTGDKISNNEPLALWSNVPSGCNAVIRPGINQIRFPNARYCHSGSQQSAGFTLGKSGDTVSFYLDYAEADWKFTEYEVSIKGDTPEISDMAWVRCYLSKIRLTTV